MPDSKPKTVLRSDYAVPDYLIETVDLAFDLREDGTRVEARLGLRRRADAMESGVPLVLVGESVVLDEIEIDGRVLLESEYRVEGEELIVNDPPRQFELRTVVTIHPEKNTQLSGLYKSSGNFCTQCEAMGFRRITYFLDRPDVMARYSVSIEAERAQYPVLLSNGNRIEESELPDGRHRVRWEDPFPKPSYLFALVAGDLRCHAGQFRTMSGRDVQLEIWVEPQNVDRCDHALRSLKRAMKWDEERFGREYDLELYMIVAVGDFNMGAMENKGLNVFNSKYVLALPETATDDDYEGIESVIAHEYFHNWTGNRVTCRDWFQLTLKEGLTVYRDQRFSEDMISVPVCRIAEIKGLRARQFPEDEGPMAHPIRPDSYISMDNFYTATVYDKGAEVIRMYATLLGDDGFRKGMDLYFDRHDGQAVTCNDFRAAMSDASGRDLAQFERWYDQAGTPRLRASGEYDAPACRYVLTLSQDYPETAFEIVGADARDALHCPVAVGLLRADGSSMALRLEGESEGEAEAVMTAFGGDPDHGASLRSTRVLELREARQEFVFEGIDEEPVPSILRGFSAPVRLEMDRPQESLAFLMAHDDDPVNRWDAGQQLALELLVTATTDIESGRTPELDVGFSTAWVRVLGDEGLDGSLRALALSLPGERVVAQEMDVIHPDAIHAAREFMGKALAAAHADRLWSTFRALSSSGPYRHERSEIDRRRLRNIALRMLVWTGEEEAIQAAWAQFQEADNMTDAQAAFMVLADQEHEAREQVTRAFYERWKSDPLVMDKWFSIQAGSSRPDAFVRVEELTRHADFNLANPNRVRSLVGAFCSGNQVRFHASSGEGYVFLADHVLKLNESNPQVASRMVSVFNDWRRYGTDRQAMMQAQLERIASSGSLSDDVYEIVNRALSR
ncbi:MAG: aminopeptidase N [Myxococcales bacterium]|nr:aminopeptidase N [Myxococcales bacterium]HIK84714.1 aminopeptidase N [Myxococcales bacterium]